MRLSTALIGLIVVSLVVSVFGLFFSDLQSSYNPQVSNATVGAFNQFNQTKNLTDSVSESIRVPKSTSIVDQVGYFLSASVTTLTLTLGSIGVFSSLVTAVAVFFGVPPIISTIFIVIFTLSIVLLIVGAIMRWYI